MKNIKDILKEFGIELPEEKQAEFDKTFNSNYKTVSEVENLNTKLTTLQGKYDTDISARDKDLEDLKTQLGEAGTDKAKLEELTGKFTTLQTDYDNAKTQYEEQLANQQREFLIKEATNDLKFSSNSAKRAFLADMEKSSITVEDGKLMGFNDFVDNYKQTDADAFVTEQKEEPKKKPAFVDKTKTHTEPEVVEKPEVPQVW